MLERILLAFPSMQESVCPFADSGRNKWSVGRRAINQLEWQSKVQTLHKPRLGTGWLSIQCTVVATVVYMNFIGTLANCCTHIEMLQMIIVHVQML